MLKLLRWVIIMLERLALGVKRLYGSDGLLTVGRAGGVGLS